MGFFGSIIGLFCILTGLPFLAAGLGFQNTLSNFEGVRLHETLLGAGLIIVGIVIGKFWSLKVKPRRTATE